MIPYVLFSVAINGLSLKDEFEIEKLRIKIDEAVRGIKPSLVSRFDSDVEVEILEHAGEKNKIID